MVGCSFSINPLPGVASTATAAATAAAPCMNWNTKSATRQASTAGGVSHRKRGGARGRVRLGEGVSQNKGWG